MRPSRPWLAPPERPPASSKEHSRRQPSWQQKPTKLSGQEPACKLAKILKVKVEDGKYGELIGLLPARSQKEAVKAAKVHDA